MSNPILVLLPNSGRQPMQKSGPCGARLFRNPRRALENYEGDHVLIHWTGNGTYAERLATVTGETIPPTRRRVRVSGALLTEVRDGKIMREWTYWDQLSLLSQLGITDQPGLFLSPEGFQDGSQRSDQSDA